ncbi:MAG: NADH-quinone oxidoreductase subunit NuoG [Anaerolineales bacterium]|nr:NADH-quinone oxidoreductase subunit NuoG [Anaerolineales bacterium]MCZ2123339.1 NADH-quinone oxidoreductase subunit NuoG [Anaerolineales bacterium]
MSKQVTITINGKQVQVPEGSGLVEAAKLAGVDIPVFCHHPKLEPAGMCRMCLVEIGRPMIDPKTKEPIIENGAPKIQYLPKLETACTNRVSEGMVVLTQSEKAKSGQYATLEFLLTSHPLDCPICDKGGECSLQDLTMRHGPGKTRFILEEKQHFEKPLPIGDLIYLDRERCIQCSRCIRFQDQIAGESVLGFEDRGRGMQIVSISDPEFDSIFSGNTTDICPVGALTTADFRFGARPWELQSQASICTQCPVGCNLTLNTRREAQAGGEIVVKRVMPRQNEEVNEIWICDKGRFGHHYTESKKRLTKPLIRKDDKLARASWDAAAKLAGENFAAAKKNFVILASGRLANEDLFNLKSLADHAGGTALLYSDMGGGELTQLVGVGAGTNLANIGKGDAILVVASDLYEEAPIWWLRVKQAADRGATLIVANPRETKLDRFATSKIRYEYGEESKAIAELSKKGKVADEFAKAKNAIILFGSEGIGLTGTSALASACATLLQETGHTGRANNGLIGVWQRSNDQGAFEIGFQPEADLDKALKGKAVYIVGADPVGDDPILAKALSGAKFVAAQELLETATTEIADVVFPAQAFTEREGTYTSGERRVQRFYPAVAPKGDSKPDFAITALIAKQMGIILEGSSASVVFDILSHSVDAFAELSYARLAETKPQWPIVGRGDMYYGGTTYENKQGMGIQLIPTAQTEGTVRIPKVRKEAALHPKEKEALAVPVNKLYDLGVMIASAELLEEHIGKATVRMHSSTAQKFGVETGQIVTLNFEGLDGEALAQVDDTVPAGVALVPRSMGLAIHEPLVGSLQLKTQSGKGK